MADRKSTRLNSSHSQISYAVFCLKKKKEIRAGVGAGRCRSPQEAGHGWVGAVVVCPGGVAGVPASGSIGEAPRRRAPDVARGRAHQNILARAVVDFSACHW